MIGIKRGIVAKKSVAIGLGVYQTLWNNLDAGAIPTETITITTQPTAAGLTDADAGETHAEIIARLTQLGVATTSGLGGVTTIVTLSTSGGDPVAADDVINGIRFRYRALGAADVVIDVPVSIVVAAIVSDFLTADSTLVTADNTFITVDEAA